MTFNIRVIVPSDPFSWEQRKNWIYTTIDTYRPDVIGMQEITPYMLEWIKAAFQETYDIYSVNRVNSIKDGEYIAILSKKTIFTVGKKGAFMLSETPSEKGSIGWDAEYPRVCQWLELSPTHKNTSVMRIYNTHLDHIGKNARQNGLQLIKKEMQRVKLPVVLTGDFNDTPDSGALHKVASMRSCYAGFNQQEKEHSLTFHDYKGGTIGSPIDYILSDNNVNLSSTKIIRDRYKEGYPSDHYPILTTITFP